MNFLRQNWKKFLSNSSWKSQPNFNMVVGKPLPCQFPMHWPTNFATKHTKCLKYPKRSYFESKLATITFNTDSRALTVIKLIVTQFWCFGKNDTFFVIFKLCDVFVLCDKIKQDLIKSKNIEIISNRIQNQYFKKLIFNVYSYRIYFSSSKYGWNKKSPS